MKKKNVLVRVSTSFLMIPFLNTWWFLISLGLATLSDLFGNLNNLTLVLTVVCLALLFSIPFYTIVASLIGIGLGIGALCKGESKLKGFGIIALWLILLIAMLLSPLLLWSIMN